MRVRAATSVDLDFQQYLRLYRHNVLQQLNRFAHLSASLVYLCECALRRHSIGVLFHQHLCLHRHDVLQHP